MAARGDELVKVDEVKVDDDDDGGTMTTEG
jgi:hypothetical protein